MEHLEKEMSKVDCVAEKTGMYNRWEVNDDVIVDSIEKFQVSDEFKNASVHHFAHCSKMLHVGRRDRFVSCFMRGLTDLETECFAIVQREKRAELNARRHHHHHRKHEERVHEDKNTEDKNTEDRPRVIHHKVNHKEQQY